MEPATKNDLKDLMKELLKELKVDIKEAVAEAFGNSKPALEPASTPAASQLLPTDAPASPTTIVDVVPVLVASAASAKPLDIDATGVVPPTPTTYSTECPSRDVTTSTSVFTLGTTPISATSTIDVTPVLDPSMVTNEFTRPSRLLQETAPALIHELKVLRPLPWPSFKYSQVSTLWQLEKFMNHTKVPSVGIIVHKNNCSKHLVSQDVGRCLFMIRHMRHMFRPRPWPWFKYEFFASYLEEPCSGIHSQPHVVSWFSFGLVLLLFREEDFIPVCCCDMIPREEPFSCLQNSQPRSLNPPDRRTYVDKQLGSGMICIIWYRNTKHLVHQVVHGSMSLVLGIKIMWQYVVFPVELLYELVCCIVFSVQSFYDLHAQDAHPRFRFSQKNAHLKLSRPSCSFKCRSVHVWSELPKSELPNDYCSSVTNFCLPATTCIADLGPLEFLEHVPSPDKLQKATHNLNMLVWWQIFSQGKFQWFGHRVSRSQQLTRAVDYQSGVKPKLATIYFCALVALLFECSLSSATDFIVGAMATSTETLCSPGVNKVQGIRMTREESNWLLGSVYWDAQDMQFMNWMVWYTRQSESLIWANPFICQLSTGCHSRNMVRACMYENIQTVHEQVKQLAGCFCLKFFGRIRDLTYRSQEQRKIYEQHVLDLEYVVIDGIPMPDKLQGTMQIMGMSAHWQFLSQEEFKGSGRSEFQSNSVMFATLGLVKRLSELKPLNVVAWSDSLMLSAAHGVFGAVLSGYQSSMPHHWLTQGMQQRTSQNFYELRWSNNSQTNYLFICVIRVLWSDLGTYLMDMSCDSGSSATYCHLQAMNSSSQDCPQALIVMPQFKYGLLPVVDLYLFQYPYCGFPCNMSEAFNSEGVQSNELCVVKLVLPAVSSCEQWDPGGLNFADVQGLQVPCSIPQLVDCTLHMLRLVFTMKHSYELAEKWHRLEGKPVVKGEGMSASLLSWADRYGLGPPNLAPTGTTTATTTSIRTEEPEKGIQWITARTAAAPSSFPYLQFIPCSSFSIPCIQSCSSNWYL